MTKLLTKGSSLFAATSGGVFLTTDEGAHWSNVSTGLGDSLVYTLTVTKSDIYAGTHRSIWRRSLSDFGVNAVAEKPTLVPQELQLSRNYPNPFNSATTFTFTASQSRDYRIEIFNDLGAKIVSLPTSKIGQGKYSAAWNASGWASGVYYYRVSEGTSNDLSCEAKSFLLLR